MKISRAHLDPIVFLREANAPQLRRLDIVGSFLYLLFIECMLLRAIKNQPVVDRKYSRIGGFFMQELARFRRRHAADARTIRNPAVRERPRAVDNGHGSRRLSVFQADFPAIGAVGTGDALEFRHAIHIVNLSAAKPGNVRRARRAVTSRHDDRAGSHFNVFVLIVEIYGLKRTDRCACVTGTVDKMQAGGLIDGRGRGHRAGEQGGNGLFSPEPQVKSALHGHRAYFETCFATDARVLDIPRHSPDFDFKISQEAENVGHRRVGNDADVFIIPYRGEPWRKKAWRAFHGRGDFLGFNDASAQGNFFFDYRDFSSRACRHERGLDSRDTPADDDEVGQTLHCPGVKIVMQHRPFKGGIDKGNGLERGLFFIGRHPCALFPDIGHLHFGHIDARVGHHPLEGFFMHLGGTCRDDHDVRFVV